MIVDDNLFMLATISFHYERNVNLSLNRVCKLLIVSLKQPCFNDFIDCNETQCYRVSITNANSCYIHNTN